MDSDSDSDCDSVIDPETVNVECDVDVQADPELFEEDSEEELSGESYVSKCRTTEWFKDPAHFRGRSVLDARNESGSFTVDLCKIKTPIDAFEVFLDCDVLQTVIKFTNAEAAYDSSFKPVCLHTMQAFIGILVGAGKNHDSKIHIRELWSNDDIMSRIFYSAVMGRNR